jgi:hypothetical protein
MAVDLGFCVNKWLSLKSLPTFEQNKNELIVSCILNPALQVEY